MQLFPGCKEDFESERDIDLLNIREAAKSLSNDQLIATFRKMTAIRSAEKILAEGRKSKIIKGPVHLSVGQEAIPAGISEYLNCNDSVFGAHRSHGHILSLGTDVRKFFSEILARSNGLSKGMGGSMHLIDTSVGFRGSVPIVSGSVAIAVGAALAAKMSNDNTIAVSYLGDGAVEEGVVYESLNFASVNKLPILFVCENNFFASHMHISQRQHNLSTTRVATGAGVESTMINGNRFTDVLLAASQIIPRMRAESWPFYLECATYRHYGHVDWRDDIDVGVNRSAEDVNWWRFRDPMRYAIDILEQNGIISMDEIQSIQSQIDAAMHNAWSDALKDLEPEIGEDQFYVYSK